MGELEAALALDALGINVLPAVYRDKRPAITSWAIYQQIRTTTKIGEWFTRQKRRNLLLVCGEVSHLLGLDLDSRAAGVWWRQFDGMTQALDSTTCVKTGKGYHYWFRTEEGVLYPCTSYNQGQVRFDVRGEGGLLIAPPSIHPNGKPYEWVRGPESMQPVPQALRDFLAQGEGTEGPGTGSVRSLFVDLIGHPPVSGDRNNWLARVAGHLAGWVPFKDAFIALVRLANDQLEAPLDWDEEVAKLAESVWAGHQRRHSIEAGAPTPENGFLVGTGTQLLTPVKRGEIEGLLAWANFDARVTGLVQELDVSGRAWVIDLNRHREGDTRHTLLPEAIVSHPQKLATWLSGHGVVIFPPKGDTGGRNRPERLQLYLDSQEAPECKAADYLGWHDGIGFVTHEGLLTPNGMEPYKDVMPHPRLKQWAPYRYGFTSEEEARRVLREVLSFQDETVMAVFGAWWAAVWLKAQIVDEAKMFPFMGIEAASESGKTVGAFAMMIQLNGNAMGQGDYTIAALRDFASAHRNGIVWVDDTSQPDQVMELLRQATAEGSRAKKGQDRTSQESIHLLAPIVISAEGLGPLRTEKALLDRAVLLNHVPSPINRMSLHTPEKHQWADVLALWKQYGSDLTKVAGTLGGMTLENESIMAELPGLRVGGSRWGTKLGILRLGGRLLSVLTDDLVWAERVDAWTLDQPNSEADNFLTLELLPRLLRDWSLNRGPHGGPPVFVDDEGLVWFSQAKIADAWRKLAQTPRERQLGGLDSIQQQRRALGIEGLGQRLRTGGVNAPQVRYHVLSSELSLCVTGRAGISFELADDKLQLDVTEE